VCVAHHAVGIFFLPASQPMEDAMDKKLSEDFFKDVEGRISPARVAVTYQGAEFLRKLPLSFQRHAAAKGAKTDPYMGFVVEPYSLFVAYEIDPAMAASFLPPHYRLVPTSLFRDEPEYCCAILGMFNIHTSVFWGSRFELYVIAQDERSGLLSWVMCDYESNTINYDPGKGFLGPTTDRCVCTTAYDSRLICDMSSKKGPNRLSLTVTLASRGFTPLSKRLWVEGNLSIDYAGELDNKGDDPFGLIFDPGEMAQAWKITENQLEISGLRFGFLDQSIQPREICCFPFAQHYVTTTFPKGSAIRDEADLEMKIRELLME
jgi:hypothetical protein